MVHLEELWPDPDRRDAALDRVLIRCYSQRVNLAPSELRVLQALSVGLGRRGAADVLGWTPMSVASISKSARLKLGAKNTTHACCEALRRGLIT